MEELNNEAMIMGSDEDLSRVNELYAGFDGDGNLIIRLYHYDYDDDKNNSSQAIMVEKDEAMILAKKLFSDYMDLPDAIASHMHLWGEIVNASPGEVEECLLATKKMIHSFGCPTLSLLLDF